jgi:DNA-binding transcriptional regulator GbsR (MarR family)
MVDKARKKFIEAHGRYYYELGYPKLCGWIEGILATEIRNINWTQQRITSELTKIFHKEDKATSLSSVNRALKILEKYGLIKKSGTRKEGYFYILAAGENYIQKMFNTFLKANENYIKSLETLLSMQEINQKEYKPTVSMYLSFTQIFNSEFQLLIERMVKNLEDD